MWRFISFAFAVIFVKPRVKSKMNVTRNAASVVIVLLIQLPVYSADKQVATGKPASQSTTLFDANRAVDGKEGDASMNNCSHTAAGQNTSWWRVDLEQPYFIKRILIKPRPTTNYKLRGRFAGFSLAVSEQEETGYHTCFDYGKDSPLPNLLMTHVVNCTPPARGRYVMISNNRDDPPYAAGYSPTAYVNLCEVEVYVEDCYDTCVDCVCSACKDGFYGVKCNRSCSLYCDGNGACQQIDGRCDSQSCKHGYYGEHCNRTCSSQCLGGSCNFSTGYCDTCNGSYFGINCTDNCPLNCASCASQTQCNECSNSYYGQICNDSCLNCGMKVCEKEDGKCINGFCQRGYFTPYCNQSCSEKCKGNGSCGFLSGMCDTCNDGFYGAECERRCIPGCKLCSNSTGCALCNEGLFGTICNRTCHPCGGEGSCNIDSGLCISNSCRAGFYGNGNKCDKNCSTTCGSDGSCDVINGTCLYGCKPGFSGKVCEENCPKNCVACDQVSKTCTDYGCNVGYQGDTCESECPTNCGGNGECSITKGVCTHGCSDGWEGSVCMSKVSAESGITTAVGGAVGGIIVLACCVIIVIIIFRRRQTQNRQSKSKQYLSVSENSLSQATDGNLYANIQLTETINGEKRMNINEGDGVSTNKVVLKMDVDESTYCNTTRNILGIKIEELKEYVSTKKSREEFAGDFAGIPYGEQHPITTGKEPQNILKNRYKTTFPYDHSRVILEGKADYINANYIEDTEGNRRFIASQGPTKNSLTDFWQMVWQSSIDIIIMLTNLSEGTKRKCEQYWPEQNVPKTYGQFKLTLKDEKSFSFYVLRDINIEDTKLRTKRCVYQFHFTTWPDHGTPDPFLLVKFHRRVISQQHHLSGPMLVHCSAGVGRTGTFIALDALHREGKNSGRINVEAYVRTMRKDRMNMIQNEDQYEMLHDALIEAFQWQDTSTTMDTFPSLWEIISKDRKPINQQRLKQEYDMLMKLKSEVEIADKATAKTEENKRKNRYTDIVPSDNHRPYLSSYFKEGTNYINSVIIPSSVSMKAYFVTQTPLPFTVVDFWRLLSDHDSFCVIHFYSPGDDEVSFYPTNDVTLETDLHLIKKEFLREHQQNISEIKLQMKNKKSDEAKDVTLLRVDLGEQKLVSPTKLFKAIEVVETFRRKHEECPVTIVSSDGCTHCDVFCTVANTIEHMKIDNTVDIFQTARQLLFRRPEFFKDYETYRFCYQVINDYLSMESVYVNS